MDSKLRIKERPYSLLACFEFKRISSGKDSVKTGIPRQTIDNWMNGIEPKNISQVKKIADKLGVSVDKLCFDDVPEKESEDVAVYEVAFLRRVR